MLYIPDVKIFIEMNTAEWLDMLVLFSIIFAWLCCERFDAVKLTQVRYCY